MTDMEALWERVREQVLRASGEAFGYAKMVAWLDEADVEQEAFICLNSLFEKWVGFPNRERVNLEAYIVAWLPRYLVDRVRRLTHRRAQTQEIAVDMTEEFSEMGEEPDFTNLVLCKQVRELMDGLEEAEQAVILLHLWHGWSFPRIGKALGYEGRDHGRSRARRVFRRAVTNLQRIMADEVDIP